ncbi:hypothetical protein [Bradyrhizobium sp. USDA 4486]
MKSEAALLSELIGLVYHAALDPSLWTRALEQACLFVGGSSGALFWHDAAIEKTGYYTSSMKRPTTQSSISRNILP